MLKTLLVLLTTLSISISAYAEQTLAIIKPDGVTNKHIGEIITRYEGAGFKIVGMKLVHLSKEKAQAFYAVHKDRPFYDELTTFMSSGPVVVVALEGDNAVARNRQLMGATDPKKATPGTIRADFSKSMGENTVHGSDSQENAAVEIAFFFKPEDLM